MAYKPIPAASTEARSIAIFLDGTHNDEVSDTNVKRLHSLVSLQSRPDIASLYVEGVGTGSDVLGMGLGLGFASRVKIAYEFILDNYREGDKIYIFGFSRGAYAARALTSVLHRAGIARWPGHTSHDIAEQVYDDIHKILSEHADGEPDDRVRSTLKERGLCPGLSLPVDVLGLWDSVGALGDPQWGRRLLHKAKLKTIHVNVDIPNRRHGDQLCNVRQAYHALALDDNREWAFTPLLLSRKALFAHCKTPSAGDDLVLGVDGKVRPGRLQEVWFSGAHSDVGGGYGDSMISGVSLNWMIGHLQDSLLKQLPAVREDVHGSSHNPEADAFIVEYHDINRNIGAYVVDQDRHLEEFQNSLCIHKSVFERRRLSTPLPYENHQLALVAPGPICLIEDTAEGKANPLRLKQDLRDPHCVPRILVEQWPKCKGMKR